VLRKVKPGEKQVRLAPVEIEHEMASAFFFGQTECYSPRGGSLEHRETPGTAYAGGGLGRAARRRRPSWPGLPGDCGKVMSGAPMVARSFASGEEGRAVPNQPAASRHVPVMLEDVLAALAVRRDGAYLDATFGGGGYARAILEAGAGRLLGLDRDPAAVARGLRLAAVDARFVMLEGCFGDMAALLAKVGVEALDGIVLDLGLSSDQLADASRGFALTSDGPLDMRMSGRGRSAAEVIDQADDATLADILFRYGEERAARRIARAIVARRRRAPLRTTRELAELVGGVLGGSTSGRIDPATRTFQALRIQVNDELGELERALLAAERLLLPGGRLVVVAFHSLEDRIVKRFLAERSGRTPRPSRHLPEIAGTPPAVFRPLTRRAVRPGAEEIAANPRARSARLRAAERLAEVAP
jgi:16S rRNA (cytosine1402-N4)-methyltransferase